LKSAVILAGGFSRRFGSDKALVLLKQKPLVCHVIDQISLTVNEVLVVVSNNKQKKKFQAFLKNFIKIVIDEDESQSPLVGALTGFENASGKYSLLLPCDTPLISTKIIEYLWSLKNNSSGVIPKWPNGYLEPLQAIYNTESATIAAKAALKEGLMNMRSMIEKLNTVEYVSTSTLNEIDPNHLSFFNINNPKDLEKAEFFLK
jgi:molybdopterin-guanine dinucleotide biosynthesis protein A